MFHFKCVCVCNYYTSHRIPINESRFYTLSATGTLKDCLSLLKRSHALPANAGDTVQSHYRGFIR